MPKRKETASDRVRNRLRETEQAQLAIKRKRAEQTASFDRLQELAEGLMYKRDLESLLALASAIEVYRDLVAEVQERARRFHQAIDSTGPNAIQYRYPGISGNSLYWSVSMEAMSKVLLDAINFLDTKHGEAVKVKPPRAIAKQLRDLPGEANVLWDHFLVELFSGLPVEPIRIQPINKTEPQIQNDDVGRVDAAAGGKDAEPIGIGANQGNSSGADATERVSVDWGEKGYLARYSSLDKPELEKPVGWKSCMNALALEGYPYKSPRTLERLVHNWAQRNNKLYAIGVKGDPYKLTIIRPANRAFKDSSFRPSAKKVI